MIHEDEDEIEEAEPIAFSWIIAICLNKLNLNLKEAGRLTYRQFKLLYRAYQDTFDQELLMSKSGITYEKLRAEANKSEEWLN